MKKQALFGILVLASTLVLSGCVARTYPLTRDRVDQDLESGNRGYLSGSAPYESNEDRKTDRTVRVFEIELGSPFKGKNKTRDTQNQNLTSNVSSESSESSLNTPYSSESTSSSYQKYTVGKGDTLQKISKKCYGTSKKWMKIYNANKDVLKGPDKVYPGQILNIPDVTGNTAEESLNEPKENLK